MYLSKDLKILTNEVDKFLDMIDINMSLDINDIPFTNNIGIVTNFNKNTYELTMNYISELISHLIESSGYSDRAKLNSINYDQINNIFTISINFDGESKTLDINGGV